MQFGLGSSLQRNSVQGGSSNPEGRRLDSKFLPSVRRLGKGLSGYLYETTWQGKKYVRKDFPLRSVCHIAFEKEAIALLDLEHPNIVRCPHYAVGKSGCSLVLEYVDDDLQNIIQKNIEAQGKGNRTGSSTTLRSRLLDIDEARSLVSSMAKRREITGADVGPMKMSENEPTPPFEVPKAVDIIFEIATGVKYLHDNGIVHGDLKPNNVLVGYSGIVKLVDFGLVETKKRIKLVSKRTRHFEILMWKAPERFERLLGPITKYSDDPFTDSDTDEDEEIESSVKFTMSKLAMADVYSFGLVCSHILGGKLMYSNLSLTQLRKQRMHGFRPQLPSSCPDGLQVLIFSSMERDPRRRPTFAGICTTLKSFQSNRLPRPMQVERKKARSVNFPPMSFGTRIDELLRRKHSQYGVEHPQQGVYSFYEEIQRIALGDMGTTKSTRRGQRISVLVTAIRFALRLREKWKKAKRWRIQKLATSSEGELSLYSMYEEIQRIALGDMGMTRSTHRGRRISVLVTAIRFALRLKEKWKKARRWRIQKLATSSEGESSLYSMYEEIQRIALGDMGTTRSVHRGRRISVLVTAIRFTLRLREKWKKARRWRIQKLATSSEGELSLYSMYEQIQRIALGDMGMSGSAQKGRMICVLCYTKDNGYSLCIDVEGEMLEGLVEEDLEAAAPTKNSVNNT